jgi:hypothetical protein
MEREGILLAKPVRFLSAFIFLSLDLFCTLLRVQMMGCACYAWDICAIPHYTTTLHPIPNRQIDWENHFHRQKVSWESILLTNHVCHRKSDRQRPFPTDIYMPTDCLTPLLNLSRLTFSLPTNISFLTNIYSRQTVGWSRILPTNFLIMLQLPFLNHQFDGIFNADQL